MRKIIQTALRILLTTAVIALIGLMILHHYVIAKRNEAYALKREALTLVPGKSTIENVRTFVRKYGSPADYVDRCDSEECHVSIGIFALHSHSFFDTKIFNVIGIRPAHYGVIIDVAHNLVDRVQFYVFYRTPNGHWFSASTHIINAFSQSDYCSGGGLDRHPEYALLSGSLPPPVDETYLAAGITPKATTEEQTRAQTINLNCITAVHGCGASDVMPFAYADSKQELVEAKSLNVQEACKATLNSTTATPPWWASGWRKNPTVP